MKHHKTEQGQALVLIVFAIIGLVSITGLVVDGGLAYANNRQSQNAADSAAFSAALAKVRGNSIQTAAETIAQTNGFDNTQITVNSPPATGCGGQNSPYASAADSDQYVQVVINSTVQTTFANIIGIQELDNCVEAVARATPPTKITPFDGNAIIGLNPNGLSFNAQSNAVTINVQGGGIFSNSNAQDKHSNVVFLDEYCATSVGTATGFTCTASTGNTNLAYTYPDDITELLPPIPSCDGIANVSGGIVSPEAGKEASGSKVDLLDDTFYNPGLYCITEANGNFHGTISGMNVTFYIMDTNFTMKFNGGGGMALQAPTSDDNPYKGILMFSNITSTPCSQNIDFRGNGTANNAGTVFMPSACITALGNSDVNAKEYSQIIGYEVYVNGSGTLNVNFQPDDSYKAPVPPKITLIQ